MPSLSLAPLLLALVHPSAFTAHVTVDYSKAQDVKPWAEMAQKLVITWYPKIVAALEAPKKDVNVRLVFDPGYTGVAATGGGTITINPDWIRKHPGDKGMVVHELTHVVQAYHHGGPGWLTEGIADYIRFFVYEPQTKIRAPKPTSQYREAYRTVARFLNWAQVQHDPRLVIKMDHAMRDGTYSPRLWNETCGGNIDAVWASYLREEAR